MLRLVFASIRNAPVRSILLAVPLFLGTTAVFVAAVCFSITERVVSFQTSPLYEDEIIVTPQMRENSFSLLPGKSTEIGDEDVVKIRSIAGIANVFARRLLKQPVSIRISFLGQTLQTDAPVFGIEPETVRLDVDEEEFRAGGGEIPIVLSRDLMILLGTNLADALGYPKVSESLLLGKKVEILTGYSSFLGFGGEEGLKLEGKIVGFSSRVPLIGMSVPSDDLARFSRDGRVETKISSLLAHVQWDADRRLVERTIGALGLSTDSLSKRLSLVQDHMQTLLSLFIFVALFLGSFVVVAVAAIVWSDVHLNTHTIGIMRAFGATRREVGWFFAGKIILIALVSTLLGCLAGMALVWRIFTFVQESIPGLVATAFFPPVSFVSLSCMILVAMTALALFSSLPALIRAMRLSPVTAMREEG